MIFIIVTVRPAAPSLLGCNLGDPWTGGGSQAVPRVGPVSVVAVTHLVGLTVWDGSMLLTSGLVLVPLAFFIFLVLSVTLAGSGPAFAKSCNLWLVLVDESRLGFVQVLDH